MCDLHLSKALSANQADKKTCVYLILLCSMEIHDVLNTKHELRYKIYKLRNSNVWQLLFDACISILENPLAIRV